MSDLTPAMKAAAAAMSRHATAAGFRLREHRNLLARAAVDAALPVIAAELLASTATTSLPLAEYRAQCQSGLLRDLAAELRASRATGGIEYVDATWLEGRALHIERTARIAEGGDRE